jgi:predicted ABC-type ATPase
MSHPSKLDFIKKAKNLGYKTYLYFVSLENPEMNVDRVDARVKQEVIVSLRIGSEKDMNFL